MLQKKDKLPVVGFTFSRQRCNENADSLTTLDLTTEVEKSHIHVFFNNSISLLKGSDQKLPQVCYVVDYKQAVWSTYIVHVLLLDINLFNLA